MADFFGNLFGGGSGSDSFTSPQNILGALVVGSQIFGNLGQQDQADRADARADRQEAEAQRRWEAEFAFSKEKWAESLKKGAGGGGGGGGSGAALAIQKSNLIKNAYDNMIALAQGGRAEEAKQLANIVSQIQRPLLAGGA